MRSQVRVLDTEVRFEGENFQVTVDQVIEPGGVTARREVVCHSDSVVVLPHLDHGKVLLVRQYRYPVRESLWELVAGGIEAGETPARAAARELLEEAGYRAGSFKPVLRFFSSPGFLTEQMHLVEAAGLVREKAQPEADEQIRARVFTRSELKSLVRNRKIKDGKTLVGLLWLFHNRPAR
ncbi:MAG: NUDIX hydrolase [Terriglobia bacterium]